MVSLKKMGHMGMVVLGAERHGQIKKRGRCARKNIPPFGKKGGLGRYNIPWEVYFKWRGHPLKNYPPLEGLNIGCEGH